MVYAWSRIYFLGIIFHDINDIATYGQSSPSQTCDHYPFPGIPLFGFIGLVIFLVVVLLVVVLHCLYYKRLAKERNRGTVAKSNCPENAYQDLNLPELSASLNSNVSHVYQGIHLDEHENTTQSEGTANHSGEIHSIYKSLGSTHEYIELTASLTDYTANPTAMLHEEIPAQEEK